MVEYEVDYELVNPCCGDRPGRYMLPGQTLTDVMDLLVQVEQGRVTNLTITQAKPDD